MKPHIIIRESVQTGPGPVLHNMIRDFFGSGTEPNRTRHHRLAVTETLPNRIRQVDSTQQLPIKTNRVSVIAKLQALVYDILPSLLEEDAVKRCSECASLPQDININNTNNNSTLWLVQVVCPVLSPLSSPRACLYARVLGLCALTSEENKRVWVCV